MAKIIIHQGLTIEEVNAKRLQEDFLLSYQERISKAFKLMRLSLLFSRDKISGEKFILINKKKLGSV